MELTTFTSNDFGRIRAMEANGAPAFVGKDVAECLGYSNASKAVVMHVDEEDRFKVMLRADSQNGNVVTETTMINESGLYSLILSSKLPGAKKFKRWVTSEVLPSIRKHGMYAVDEILDDPDAMIAVLEALKEERKKRKSLELTTAVQKQQIAELQPKASYYDLILQNKNTVPVTQIAKDYGMSGRKFNQLLHEMGVQYRLYTGRCKEDSVRQSRKCNQPPRTE